MVISWIRQHPYLPGALMAIIIVVTIALLTSSNHPTTINTTTPQVVASCEQTLTKAIKAIQKKKVKVNFKSKACDVTVIALGNGSVKIKGKNNLAKLLRKRFSTNKVTPTSSNHSHTPNNPSTPNTPSGNTNNPSPPPNNNGSGSPPNNNPPSTPTPTPKPTVKDIPPIKDVCQLFPNTCNILPSQQLPQLP